MPGFLGGDWSRGNLQSKLKGILADPNQLLSNPMFTAGMGILSETSKPFGGDPFGAAMGGMAASKQMQLDQEERERQQKARDEIAQLLRSLGVTPGGQPISPGTPMVGPQGAQVPAAGSIAAANRQYQGMGDPRSVMGQPAMQKLLWEMAIGRDLGG